MFAQHNLSALLAVLLTSALLTPALSAEADVATPAMAGPQSGVAMPEAGPVIARESLAADASARASMVVGENQPTRATGSPTVRKPYVGTRHGYYRPAYRYGLLLGIGY